MRINEAKKRRKRKDKGLEIFKFVIGAAGFLFIAGAFGDWDNKDVLFDVVNILRGIAGTLLLGFASMISKFQKEMHSIREEHETEELKKGA